MSQDANEVTTRRGHPFGSRHRTIPIPPVDVATEWLQAGRVLFGVEHRVLDKDILYAHFASMPEQMELLKTMTGKSDPLDIFALPEDEGFSLHVCDAKDRQEYIRFDAFAEDPHYHYITPGSHHVAVGFDNIADDFEPWVFARVQSALPEMLRFAGAHDLAGEVDQDLVRQSLGTLRDMAQVAKTRGPRG